MKAWESNVRKCIPYTPGEQPKEANIIKLNTNENPYPPAPGVAKVIDEMDESRLRLYPDPAISPLVNEIANYYNRDQEEIFVGVGSDDVLSMIYLTFFNSGKPILFPDITYSFYPVWSNVYNVPYETVELDKDFRIVKEGYYRENGGIIIANPNAPTSIYEDLDVIEDIIKANHDVIVVIDEAYIDFGGKSAIELVDQYDNLLVVQTFSKSRSMAGMRIGYAIGNKELIGYLQDVKYSVNSYTLNLPSILTGVEAVRDNEYFKETRDKIMRTRESANLFLKELGFECLQSKANFLFARHKEVPAKTIFEALKSAGIYVRFFDMPRIDNYLRITIGTDEEMAVLREFLTKYLK